MIDFTVPEINIVCIYKGETMTQTIQNTMSALEHMTESKKELKAEMETVIIKLNNITETEFAEYVFEPVFE
jgi:hypothetical protein